MFFNVLLFCLEGYSETLMFHGYYLIPPLILYNMELLLFQL